MLELLYGEFNGDVQEVYNYEQNIRAVKLEGVKKMAKLKNYSFFALVPE